MKQAMFVPLVMALLLGVPAYAQTPGPPSHDLPQDQEACRTNPSGCGIAIQISDDLGGVDNCSGPNCLTHRIVNLEDLATDYMPFPLNRDFGPTPDGEDEEGNATCTRQPAGRLPAAWWQIPMPVFGDIGMSPEPEGLTGLESWFWYEGATDVSWTSPVYAGVGADCSLIPAPPPVTYTASITSYRWEIDDSRPATVTSQEAGSADEPSARHTYRTRGEWEVRARCTWTGSPTTPLEWDCAQRTVPVTTVRSVLTD